MTTSATLFFSNLLLACSIIIIASSPLSSAQTPILDTDGNPVQAGVDYYAVPPAGTTTGGGGLTLQGRTSLTCPLDVVQDPNQKSNGLPLYFQPVNPNDSVVNSGTDQNVFFNASSTCVMSTLWTLTSRSDPNQFYVSTGGAAGNPGRQTLSNWFAVRSFEGAYIFYYCPTVCDTCRPVCGNLGIIVQNGRRVLGLSNQPLKVTFKKL